jgi:hypothetical protein
MKMSHVVPAALALAAVIALGTAAARPAPAPLSVITVYKSPTCGCCQKWVDYLRSKGFQVKTVDLADLTEIKAASGVPAPLQTCHTAVVEGYVVEGHVPADVLQKLLHDRPKVAGIAVPGMPIGSPGMDGSPAQSYDVIAWDKTGKTSVFAKE